MNLNFINNSKLQKSFKYIINNIDLSLKIFNIMIF